MKTTRQKPRSQTSPRHLRLGQLLAEARQDAALSQVQVAHALGQPQSYVSRYESGFRRLDAVELLLVADAIQCDLQALFDEVKLVPP